MKKILFIALLFSLTQVNAQVCFKPATIDTAGTFPNSICISDFNNDGFKDLAVANGNDNNVSILLGTGTGSFGTATNFTVGSSPYSVTSADFNGDGKADLATANFGSDDVSILLGTGTGSFGTATNFTVGTGPYSVTSADFNGDAIADLATANYYSNDISIVLGTGTGSFGAATNFAVGTNPISLINADFNGDGATDLASANAGSNNISILLGNGIGGFYAITNFATGTYPVSVISADFNGDAKADLATANNSSGNVSILLGDGTGNFGAATSFLGGGIHPYAATSTDFNGDGKADLAIANEGTGNVSVFLGTGTGSFGSAINFAVGTNPESICNADFNGDTKPDLAVANTGSNNVSILLSRSVIISGTQTLCSGNSTILTASGATTYTWSANAGSATTATVSVSPPGNTTYSVTGIYGTCSYTQAATVTVTATPTVYISGVQTICLGNSTILTGGVAATYTWSANAGNATTNTISVNPTATTTYTLTGANGTCTALATSTVTVVTPTAPTICMVSVDSTSTNNIIYWDKTVFSNMDSFIVYREVSTGIYKRIGAVSKNSLSMFVDVTRSVGPANGNPNVGFYHYKLQIRDTCGNYSSLSPYHTSVYFIDNHNGTFTWNTYDVESSATPVANFNLLRDSVNTNNWRVIGSVAGTTTTLNDPTYATYQAIGNWRVDALGFTCTPTMRLGNNSVQGAITKSRSNVKNNRTTNSSQLTASSAQLKVFPNPGNGFFTIQSEKELGLVYVYNSLGEIVFQSTIQQLTSATIDISKQPAGIYILWLSTPSGQTQGKHIRLIKE